MVTAEQAREQIRRNKNWLEIVYIYEAALKRGDGLASNETEHAYRIAAFFEGCGGRPAVFTLYKDKYDVEQRG